MKRLLMAAMCGLLIGVSLYFLVAAGLALLAPSNRLPRASDLANPFLLWPGGIGVMIGIMLNLIGAHLRRALQSSWRATRI